MLWKDKKLYQKCPVVVFLRLRDSSVQCAKEPQDLFHYPDQDVQRKVHRWVLCNSGHGCLLILDGYDELPAGAQTNSVFSRIIGGELPQAQVIVTSRSSAMHNLLELCKTQEVQHVEILGFTEEQVRDYVSSAFKQDQKSRCGFEEYLRCHPHLQGLMYIPLNAAIVVGVYQDNQARGCIPNTMTELYTALVLYLVHHHHHRDPANSPMGPTDCISDLPAHYYKSIKSMAEIAYQGCLEDKLVFQKMPMSLETLGVCMWCVCPVYMVCVCVCMWCVCHVCMWCVCVCLCVVCMWCVCVCVSCVCGVCVFVCRVYVVCVCRVYMVCVSCVSYVCVMCVLSAYSVYVCIKAGIQGATSCFLPG